MQTSMGTYSQYWKFPCNTTEGTAFENCVHTLGTTSTWHFPPQDVEGVGDFWQVPNELVIVIG